MRKILLLLMFLVFCQAAWAENAAKPKKKTVSAEEKRKQELINRLVKSGFDRNEMNRIFTDPRLKPVPVPTPPPQAEPSKPKKHTGNPYLTSGFGLLTENSLERCFETYVKHKKIFDETETTYGVPKEFICARLRIETNFGKAMGINPIVSSLYSLYSKNRRRREFAFNELKSFLVIANKLGWDPLSIKGSYTGAFGLSQHQPSSYMNPNLVADGNRDGKIDLFSYEDAIPSIAKHDKSCGWSNDPQDQFNAIYCYNNSTDYVDAVRVYAWMAKIYLKLKLAGQNPPQP